MYIPYTQRKKAHFYANVEETSLQNGLQHIHETINWAPLLECWNTLETPDGRIKDDQYSNIPQT
jgi:hypothetical protein